MHELKVLLARRNELVTARQSLLAKVEGELAQIDASIAAYSDSALPLPPPPPVARDPKPPGSPSTVYLQWAIRQPAELDFGLCAADIYGQDTPANRQLIHRTLWYMKKRRMVERKGRRWVIRQQKRLGRPPRPR